MTCIYAYNEANIVFCMYCSSASDVEGPFKGSVIRGFTVFLLPLVYVLCVLFFTGALYDTFKDPMRDVSDGRTHTLYCSCCLSVLLPDNFLKVGKGRETGFLGCDLVASRGQGAV